MKPNPELIDSDNPEWTEEMFARARPASKVLPEILGPEAAADLLKPRGRPKASKKKTPVNIRLDADVVNAFKSKGKGWQSRVNKALREWLREHPAA
jgi:uncharacterized protein (DUF4415 family)